MTDITMTLNDKLQKLSSLMHRLNRPEPAPHAPRGHAQERALNQIALRDGLTQRELMEKLGVQPSTLSELLTKLECGGLIERHANEEDRRQVNLFISEQGRRHLEKMNLDGLRFDPFETLSDAEQQTLGELFDKLIGVAEGECSRRGLPMHPPRPFPGGAPGFRPPFEGPRPGAPFPDGPFHGGPRGPMPRDFRRPPVEDLEPPRPVFLGNNGDEENI